MSKNVRRLFETFKPDSYKLELNPDRDSMVTRGTVVVTGRKTGRPSRRLTFHQHGVRITSASVVYQNKKGAQEDIKVTRINHQATLHEVRLHSDKLLYPGRYTVTMHFTGKVQINMQGIYASNYEYEGKKRKIVSTQLESHHAREAFPCIDEPEAKATFDLTLLSPVKETVIGNMPAKSQTERDGKLVTEFETTPKMSSYLLAFVYGDLHARHTITKNGVDIRVWATKAHDLTSLDFGLDVAKRAIEFFEDYYGIPYPLAKCDHVAIPDFSSGAMENWGLITYRESCLLVDPETASQTNREYIALVVSHELSHQWFGDLVTMRWWNDLWLNESFANVMEYVAADTLFPEWQLWNEFVSREGLMALQRDAVAGVQAVRVDVHHPDEISTIFDGAIVYAKGGRLLNMLMRYVGQEDFRAGLKQYLTENAYGNTTGDDLWAALGAASGKDITNFMKPWIDRSGFPVVDVDQTEKNVIIRQHHFLLDPKKADPDRLWPVPLFSDAALPALLSTAELTQELPTLETVRLNQDALGHYIVHYLQTGQNTAIARLIDKQQLSAAERLMLLTGSFLLANAGLDSFTATLRLLEHYANEDNEYVWSAMALTISACRCFIAADPKLEEPIKSLVRKLIEKQFVRLGFAAKPKESSEDTKLRATIIGLGVYAGHEAITKQALALFDAYQTKPPAVPSELRSAVFSAAVRHNHNNAFTYLLDLDDHTNNVDLKQDILDSITIANKTPEITRLLGRLQDSDKVRSQEVLRWLCRLLYSRYSQDQTWQWLQTNWDWIEETFKEDMSYGYVPRYAAGAFNTRKLLETYKTFFGPLKPQPALTRSITIGVEELENRVVWLERDQAAVKDYFEHQ
jgi:aminopeptidase N